MLLILILDNDTFLQKTIGVKWKIPSHAFRDYDLLSRNLTYLSRAIC